MSITGTSVVQNHCLRFFCFLDTTLGEGVEDPICVFDLDLEAKMTLTIRAASLDVIQELDPLQKVTWHKNWTGPVLITYVTFSGSYATLPFLSPSL